MRPAMMVGGFPEPDGTQPMSTAEFRMVFDWLGVTEAWLADLLGVTERTVRRWKAGAQPVPDGAREQIEAIEWVAAEQVGQAVDALRDAADVVLTIQDGDHGGYPAGWWRMIAARAAQEVPGLYVRYAD